MARQILKYPHPFLCEKAYPVEEITPDLKDLVAKMAEIMYDSEGVGLAAPQIGQCSRVVVIDLSGPEKREALQVFINPEIVRADGVEVKDEGCLSVPFGYRADVKRAQTVTVRAQDLEGNEFEVEAEGLFARCLQHEIDHLNGKLFIDHISRLKRSLFDGRIKKSRRLKKDAD
ncbi:MAG: peptide deformylase [Desulfovibrionaceae bacterium]|nr:peptide deformylase [Desulfovibrionaceae bacterium]MBF0512494.1 peptide deformylase [Desulfovibrionaceae bacterium]